MVWGIDVEGRPMDFAPWTINGEGEYRTPTKNEIDSVYGISGSAIAETLEYFEVCDGDTERLVTMLNAHINDQSFKITRTDLLNAERWYTNEYYFYFIMFTKIIIGRYDFHFGEGKDKQLSRYHRKFEQGFLNCIPYGQGDEDTSNSVPFTFYTYFIKKLPHFSDFLEWAEILCAEKLVSSYKTVVFPAENIWINSELMCFLYDFTKILSNCNDIFQILFDSYTYYRYKSFMFVPRFYLPIAIEKQVNCTTDVYKIHVTNNSNGLLINFGWRDIYQKEKFSIFSKSVLENSNAVVVSGLLLGMQDCFKLTYIPTYRIFTELSEWNITFQINLPRPHFVKRMGFGFIALGFVPLLAYMLRNSDQIFLLLEGVATLLAFLSCQAIYQVFVERGNIALLKEHNENNSKEKEKSFAELKTMSDELILEKKHLEEKVRLRTAEIETTNQKLRDFDKTKTDFFYNVSHELRTPLTLIKAPLEAMRSGLYGKTIDFNSSSFNMILRNVDRLNEQVNMLLDFARIDQKRINPELVAVDLVELCGYLASELHPRALMAEIALEIVFPNIPVVALINIKLFERVFFNLGLNALKFTPQGGNLKIEILYDEDFVKLVFQDSGIGIQEDKLDYIFERFVQLDASSTRRYEGTGLGLALVKEACEIFDATIDVTSEVGKGSRFTVSLKQTKEVPDSLSDFFIFPRERYQPPISASVNGKMKDKINREELKCVSEKKSGSKPQATILLVEDTEDMRNFLKDFLSAEYRVLEAANGQEAYELYQAHDEIELVITDIMMPLMDGRQLHRKISEDADFRHIPFLFITARASPDEKIDALSMGAIDYIYKPFQIEEVLSKTSSLLSLMDGHSSYLQKEMELRISNAIRGNVPQLTTQKSLDSFAFTKRELEVARLLIEGRRNKEIAEILKLSEHTVSHHIEAIFKKSGKSNRLEFINIVK